MIALHAIQGIGGAPATFLTLAPASPPVLADQTLAHPGQFWALACLAILADLRPIPLADPARRPATVFLSVCFTFAILLVWGVGPAIAVQALATVIASLRLRLPFERAAVLMAQLVLALIAAGGVLAALHEPLFEPGQRMASPDGFALAAAAVTWFVVNYTIYVLWLRYRRLGSWRRVFTPMLGYGMLGTGAVLVLAPLFVGTSTAWTLPLLLVPVLAISQLAWLYNHQGQRLRYDTLTGLHSRQAFIDEVENLAAQYSAIGNTGPHERFALVILDLDRFRQVNTSLGHAVGNRLLTRVATRLADNVRAADSVARLGGDEFAILQPGVADTAAAMAFADHLARAFAIPAKIDGESIDIDASIGVAIFPDHGRDSATLLRHAEAAMFQAKQRVATTAVYAAKDDRITAMRWSLLADLRRALQDADHRDELTFSYQPQLSLVTGEVVGVEALLRWQHPERGLVNVEEVFEAAEHSPIMAHLTSRAVGDVVAQLAEWNAAGLTQRASVNVSVRDLETPDLVDSITRALRAHNVRADRLTVEITETALMAELHQAQKTLRNLADLGVAVSLDDFGTGYSSMVHLRRLPVNEVKIDRSFVSNMTANRDDHAVVRSIIDLGHTLGLRVVAEGVEDEQTRLALIEAGCDIAQGWLIARPMAPEQLLAWLRAGGHAPDRADHQARPTALEGSEPL